MCEIDIVNTGSDGNCTIVDNMIMLDCGVSYSKIKDKLKNIKMIFISHIWIHSDHLKGSTVKKIAFEYPNIKFVVSWSLVKSLLNCNVRKENIFVLDLDKWYNIGIAKIKLEYLYHDVPNCCIHIERKGKKIFYATDTSKIDHIQAIGYDYYLIEANYDSDDEIDKIITEYDRRGEFTHLKRVKKTHLSQLQAINWLQKNMKDNSAYYMMHEHKEKNKNENIN